MFFAFQHDAREFVRRAGTHGSSCVVLVFIRVDCLAKRTSHLPA